MMKATVLGSGSWGTALAYVFSRNGFAVSLYGRKKDDTINSLHVSPLFPDVRLPANLVYETDLCKAIKDTDYLIFSVPSKAYSGLAKDVNPLLYKKTHIISTAKGFDPLTKERLSSVLRKGIDEEKRYPIVSLIGPSFAEEVIHSLFTCLTSVSLDEEEAKLIQKNVSSEVLRVYTSTDEIGAECSAALKNVLAIASGILTGMKQGENARAALVTRGIAEIKRFSMALGGKESTFLGLTGIGDLMLTCSSKSSRNFSLGFDIGISDDPEKVLKENTRTTEGVLTTRYALEIASSHQVEMPIAYALSQVLFEHRKPSEIVPSLMLRALKNE